MTTPALQPALPGLDVTPVGARWTNLAALDPQATLDACAALRPIISTSRWLLGDLAGALYAALGEAQANQRLAQLGHDPAELTRAIVLAVAVPHDQRHPGLTWWHHWEVRRLDAEAQARWLAAAHSRRWSSRRLRHEIKAEEEKRRPALPGTERLPRPPEQLLRRALEEHTVVVWLPQAGPLSGARVRHVDPHAVPGRLTVVLDVDPAMDGQLVVDDGPGATA